MGRDYEFSNSQRDHWDKLCVDIPQRLDGPTMVTSAIRKATLLPIYLIYRYSAAQTIIDADIERWKAPLHIVGVSTRTAFFLDATDTSSERGPS
jgi:hypothetical protein